MLICQSMGLLRYSCQLKIFCLLGTGLHVHCYPVVQQFVLIFTFLGSVLTSEKYPLITLFEAKFLRQKKKKKKKFKHTGRRKLLDLFLCPWAIKRFFTQINGMCWLANCETFSHHFYLPIPSAREINFKVSRSSSTQKQIKSKEIKKSFIQFVRFNFIVILFGWSIEGAFQKLKHFPHS